LNVVNIVGRVGRDAEIRDVKGDAVAEFTLAVERPYGNKDKSQGPVEPPDWINVTVWGKKAYVAEQYVKKGGLVGIMGSLKIDRWPDKSTGADRVKAVISANRMDLLGGKSSGGYDDSPPEENPFAYDE
jgi:single-strand DNA-binding protein